MDRISAAFYQVIGGIRQFVDRNLSTNTQGTGLNALWHNGVQESILGPVLGTGQTPTDADNTQLFKAIGRMAGSNVTTVTASDTLTADNAGLVFVNATAGAITSLLPLAASAAGVPLEFIFVRTDTTANAVNVSFQGSDAQIGGSTTAFSVPAAVGTALGVLRVASDGVGHWVTLTASLASYVTTTALAAALAVYAPLASPPFTGSPTAPTQAVGDNTTKLATGAAVQQAMLGGAAQSWQNMTGSRALGTTYTNSTGRPILVCVVAGNTNYGNFSLTVAGNVIEYWSSGNGNWSQTLRGVVPAGASYSASSSVGTLNTWSELR